MMLKTPHSFAREIFWLAIYLTFFLFSHLKTNKFLNFQGTVDLHWRHYLVILR